MPMERARIVLDRLTPSCEALRGYYAELFASLDERPRKLLLGVDVRNKVSRSFAIDYECGEPVFVSNEDGKVKASFRNRYIAEHSVPFKLSDCAVAYFVLTPASGNRVKVRKANFVERIFG